jgi:hypothetical protein
MSRIYEQEVANYDDQRKKLLAQEDLEALKQAELGKLAPLEDRIQHYQSLVMITRERGDPEKHEKMVFRLECLQEGYGKLQQAPKVCLLMDVVCPTWL